MPYIWPYVEETKNSQKCKWGKREEGRERERVSKFDRMIPFLSQATKVIG